MVSLSESLDMIMAFHTTDNHILLATSALLKKFTVPISVCQKYEAREGLISKKRGMVT
jgi:hypothetical protein